MSEKRAILELNNISKVFPGVKALDDVSMTILPGEVHALCGENGAGKSTLMKIISGAQNYTSGEIILDGKKVSFDSTRDAEDNGVTMIYQEFNLIPELSVAENIYLGKLPTKGLFLDWDQLNKKTKEILDYLNLPLNPNSPVSSLTVAESQMVEIAKCLTVGSKIIIMDEPTAALSDSEAQTLFKVIHNLKSEGIAIVYISHRMDEIFEISDRITVLRNGKYIATRDIGDTDYEDIVSMMIGRSLEDLYPDRSYIPQEKVFEVKNLNQGILKNINFSLNKGEILGIVGLLGSGNFELTKYLYGALPMIDGVIYINGNEIKVKNPNQALKAGIGLITEDRKQDGLVLKRNIKENITLATLRKITQNWLISGKTEKNIVENQIKQLNIKVTDPNKQLVGNLSGGNQQKVLFAKTLETNPTICIMNEPTRGVDIGAKAEIYSIIDELTKEGKSIILVSSDMEEILGLSDRILIMRDGEIVLERQKEETNQEEILAYASGGVSNE